MEKEEQKQLKSLINKFEKSLEETENYPDEQFHSYQNGLHAVLLTDMKNFYDFACSDEKDKFIRNPAYQEEINFLKSKIDTAVRKFSDSLIVCSKKELYSVFTINAYIGNRCHASIDEAWTVFIEKTIEEFNEKFSPATLEYSFIIPEIYTGKNQYSIIAAKGKVFDKIE